MIARRSSLSNSDQAFFSGLATKHLLGLPLVAAAQVVMAYLPTRGEVDLTTLLDMLEGRGVTLVLPKVTSRRERIMEPVAVKPPWREQVTKGAYGILEPLHDQAPYDIATIEVALIPGVAFDRECMRLGFGGGYYDRFLRRLAPSTLLCGVAYSFQIVEYVPHDVRDMPMHVVCTEKKCLLRCEGVY